MSVAAELKLASADLSPNEERARGRDDQQCDNLLPVHRNEDSFEALESKWNLGQSFVLLTGFANSAMNSRAA